MNRGGKQISKKIAVKAVFVDIDGTITETKSYCSPDGAIDGNGYYNSILRDMIVERDGIPKEGARKIIKDVMKMCVRGDTFFAAKVLGFSMDELWNRCYDWAESGGIEVYPDAVSMVKTLHERGFRLLTLTNNGVLGIYAKLLRAGLAFEGGKSYFKVMYGDDSLGDSKSNPEVYTRALQREGLKGDEAVMIGDDIAGDFENARKGGIAHCLIVNRSQKKKILRRAGGIFVNSLLQVPDLLELIVE